MSSLPKPDFPAGDTTVHTALLLLRQQLRQSQTELHAAHRQLAALARSSQRDDLTDTPNRALLLDRLERAITMAQRRHAHCAVLFLDIDSFKQINDTLGHAAGDAALQLLARRLEAAVRESDAVARHGGDEFVVLLAEVSRIADVVQIARKLIADVAAPGLVCGHWLQLSVSVGIAIYPDDAADAPTLIALADAAMYRSKRRGGKCFSRHAHPLAAADPPTAPG